LENRLEEVVHHSEESDRLDDSLEAQSTEEAFEENYDVVLHVKPGKLASIKTELINGQKCILVPLNENEQASINGRKDLI